MKVKIKMTRKYRCGCVVKQNGRSISHKFCEKHGNIDSDDLKKTIANEVMK